MIAATEVCSTLNITKAQLESFVKEGLPCSGPAKKRQFNEEEVVEWLLANGKAEATKEVVDTIGQVAEHFGEKPLAVRKWFQNQGCPGSPGAYVLEDIQHWIENDKVDRGKWERPKRDREDEPQQPSVQDELRILKLETARGKLISLDEVRSEFVRQSTMVRSELSLISAKIEERLPGEVAPELRAMIRDVVNSTVESCYEIFREILQDDSDSPSDE